jgi:VWFA-related protein
MRRPVLLASALVVCSLLVAQTQSRTPPQSAPTFRAATDLVLLDVSALGKDRQPVRGLTAADFTVHIDGKPRPVVAFKAIDIPPPSPPPVAQPAWMRDVAPDVVSNARPAGRVVVIMIDDATLEAGRLDPFGMEKARQSAYVVIDRLGPDDRAAVVFTKNSHTAQGFTTDRERLRRAVREAVLLPDPSAGDDQGDCMCGVCSIRALDLVARSLRDLPEQRKVLLYISAGSVVWIPKGIKDDPTNKSEACNRERRDAMHDALRQAQLSNVRIDAVDPSGLSLGRQAMSASGRTGPRTATASLLEDPSTLRIQFLRTMAESTGGRAVVNNNEPDRQVAAVLGESESYYLLGVTPAEAPGKDGFHPVQVRVNRRDVEVRSRKGYYDPTEKERERATERAQSGDLTALLAAALARPVFPLEVAAAPFANEQRESALAISLSVWPPPNAPVRLLPRTDALDVVATLVNPETSEVVGSQQQRLTLTWTRRDSRFEYYEVLTRMPASAGRYELRVGLKTDDGQTASVYAPVEVPDFNQELALSGLVLSAAPSPTIAPQDAARDLVPFPPTARRTFRSTDEVIAFLRIYQRSRDFLPSTVTTRLTNAKNEVVATDTEQLVGEAAGTGSAAGYRIALPVSTLTPGEYLLSTSVAAGSRTAQRQLRFRVE